MFTIITGVLMIMGSIITGALIASILVNAIINILIKAVK